MGSGITYDMIHIICHAMKQVYSASITGHCIAFTLLNLAWLQSLMPDISYTELSSRLHLNRVRDPQKERS